MKFSGFEILRRPTIFHEWFDERLFDRKTKVMLPRDSDEHVQFFVFETANKEVRPAMYIEQGDSIIISNLRDCRICIKVNHITVEGQAMKPAAQAMRQFKSRDKWQLIKGPNESILVEPKANMKVHRVLTDEQ